MESVLSELFPNTETDIAGVEKLAEANFRKELESDDKSVAEPPLFDFSEMSTEDLAKFAMEAEKEINDESTSVGEQELVNEKTAQAQEDFLSRVMAHSFNHETVMMKVAMSKGLCRVCKENKAGTGSVCPECLAAAKE